MRLPPDLFFSLRASRAADLISSRDTNRHLSDGSRRYVLTDVSAPEQCLIAAASSPWLPLGHLERDWCQTKVSSLPPAHVPLRALDHCQCIQTRVFGGDLTSASPTYPTSNSSPSSSSSPFHDTRTVTASCVLAPFDLVPALLQHPSQRPPCFYFLPPNAVSYAGQSYLMGTDLIRHPSRLWDKCSLLRLA